MAMLPTWSAGYAALISVMWWAMMVAMMLPTAAPTVAVGHLARMGSALVLLLALAGCAQVATEQGQAPVPSYPHDNGPDRRGDMM